MWPCCPSLMTITPALPKQITWRSWSFSNGSSNYSQEWDCPSMANMFIVEITSTPAILWHSSWPTWSSKNVSFVYLHLRGICWQQQKDGMLDLSLGCQLIANSFQKKSCNKQWPNYDIYQWSSKNIRMRSLCFFKVCKLYLQDFAHYWPPTHPLLTFVMEFLYCYI